MINGWKQGKSESGNDVTCQFVDNLFYIVSTLMDE